MLNFGKIIITGRIFSILAANIYFPYFMKNRVQSLDYLRGLMAFGVMIYHYLLWTGDATDSGDFLGRIGVYAVSVFYILSGLTLYIVYKSNLNASNVHHYVIKRFFRIFPLLWLCIILSIYILDRGYTISTLLLNLSGLFSVFAHDKYIAIASWSIGNELVFYAVFPLIMLASRKLRAAPVYFFIVSLMVGIYFAFFLMDEALPLWAQWKMYLNPLNQIMLFAGGVLIGYIFSGKQINNIYGIGLLIISVLAFVFYPVDGDQGKLIAGINRMAFTFISFGLTISFLIIRLKPVMGFSFILSKLGEISYSVYLLHPIVYNILQKYGHVNNKSNLMISGICGTLFVSVIVYYFYEKKFMQLGQIVVARIKSTASDPVQVKG